MELLELSYVEERTDEGLHFALSSTDFDRFSSSILGLGDITQQLSGQESFDALAAIFDLEGFTSFFDGRDPQLEIPNFLDRFLGWLFEELKREFKKKELGGKVLLWGFLPVFAKFMGDGVLLLWKLPRSDRHGGALAIGNIVERLNRITKSYRVEFLPLIKTDFPNPPKKLRCGGAFGKVISVGNNQDYVGACINVASRLQKFRGLSFAVARNGCDPDRCFKGEYKGKYVTKKVQIRGIRKKELILVEKAEFDALSQKNKRHFS